MENQYEVTKKVKKPKHMIRNSMLLILAILIYLFADSNLGFIKINSYEVAHPHCVRNNRLNGCL